MNKKKFFLAVLALILVCSISVAGTLAFLTAQQDGDKAVVNTFVAQGGGIIIPGSTSVPSPTPEIPDGLNKNFFLVESSANYVNGNYVLDTDTKVIENTYDKVVPEMTIPKDPALTVNLAEGIDAYIFVKVEDTTQNNLIYTMNGVWEPTTISGVYVYVKNASGSGNAKYIVTGNSNDQYDLDAVDLFTSVNNQCTVKAAETLADTDSVKEGMQLGNLTFKAYACQAGGFENPTAAYTACFAS